MRKLHWIVLATLAMVLSTRAWAIPPAIARQYQPLPVGTNVFFFPYIHAEANTSLDQSVPVLTQLPQLCRRLSSEKAF